MSCSLIAYDGGVSVHASYGSSMNPHVMAERCPLSPLVGTGWLEGWRLTFGNPDCGWPDALATLAQDPDHRTFVALYDISPFDLPHFKAWEGVEEGVYRTIRERVHTLDGAVLAHVNVLDGYEGGTPATAHIELLIAAAESVGAPDDYIAELRKWGS